MIKNKKEVLHQHARFLVDLKKKKKEKEKKIYSLS